MDRKRKEGEKESRAGSCSASCLEEVARFLPKLVLEEFLTVRVSSDCGSKELVASFRKALFFSWKSQPGILFEMIFGSWIESMLFPLHK